MKKPTWLEKENLYRIIFEADTPAGKTFDIVLIIAILVSIIVSFVESIQSLAHTFKISLEVVEFVLTFFFSLEYAARKAQMAADRELRELDDEANEDDDEETAAKKRRRKRNERKENDVVLDESYKVLMDLVRMKDGEEVPEIKGWWY